jgi:hypothetical protein
VELGEVSPGQHPFVLAVQWHPEVGDDPSLFRALIAASNRSTPAGQTSPPPTNPAPPHAQTPAPQPRRLTRLCDIERALTCWSYIHALPPAPRAGTGAAWAKTASAALTKVRRSASGCGGGRQTESYESCPLC